MLPDEVYAGFGADCQVMTTYAASVLNKDLGAGDKRDLDLAYLKARNAQRVPCPK